jgi:hypothetical protein
MSLKASFAKFIRWDFLFLIWSTLHALASKAIADPLPPARNVVDFQPFREVLTATFTTPISRYTDAKLTNLNINANAWYVLEINGPEGKKVFHLENPDPQAQSFYLSGEFGAGIMIRERAREVPCPLWQEGLNWIGADVVMNQPYSVGCGGKVFIRNPVEGNKTTKEWLVSWARKNLSFGENIATFVKTSLLQDQYLIAPSASIAGPVASNTFAALDLEQGPMPARLVPGTSGSPVVLDRKGLGIKLQQDGETIPAGQWLRVASHPGVYVSLITAAMANPQPDGPVENQEAPAAKAGQTPTIEKTEGTAGVFQVAFDLQRYRLGFAVGTEHPSVEWSDRILAQAYDKKRAGPDGFANMQPLVANGALNPEVATRVIGVFTGGFKRGHGAFRWGELATRNSGSHYGFVENGVIFSSLQPGLATVYVDNLGNVSMGTWTEADNAKLSQIRFARQNGVAVSDWDANLKRPVVGSLINNWGAGNWSGSIDSKLRTVRAGVCLQESSRGRFLIYSYFSGATPESMARVYLAYGCSYSMHLDMNALEHTYLALINAGGNEHLIQEMNVLDKEYEGKRLKRFVDFPDNRDFFYLAPRNP